MAKSTCRVSHLTKVCLVGLEGPPAEALSYLLTHANQLQSSLEFELVIANDQDELVQLLSSRAIVPVDEKFEALLGGFSERQDRFNQIFEDGYSLPPTAESDYVIVSLAKLSDNYYAKGAGRTSLLTLGGWDTSFAPPSLVEYALTLILRLAADDAAPTKGDTRHLGTRGCLFDFNPRLDTARFKVLSGIICSDCEAALRTAGAQQVTTDIRLLLSKDWLGEADNPRAPAGICRKLGYDLFLTRGIQPTFFQSMSLKLQNELPTELIKVVGGILLAVVVFLLGLKAGAD